jgi:hypothetical protein
MGTKGFRCTEFSRWESRRWGIPESGPLAAGHQAGVWSKAQTIVSEHGQCHPLYLLPGKQVKGMTGPWILAFYGKKLEKLE